MQIGKKYELVGHVPLAPPKVNGVPVDNPTVAQRWANGGFLPFKLKKLKADAAEFCSNATLPARPALPTLAPTDSPGEVLQKMLAASRGGHNGGLVVGESHGAVAPKKLLIDNMQTLAQAGVKVLFYEHLPSEIHQADLDAYHQSLPGTPMPQGLKEALDTLKQGHMDRRPGGPVQSYRDQTERHNFRTVIEAAKAAGVRVVALDCEASCSINPNTYAVPDPKLLKERLRTMNFLAAKAVQEYAGTPGSGAWVAYVGNLHANTCQGVPGLAELTGSLALHVKDGNPSVQTRVQDKEQHDLTADAALRMPLP